MKRQKVSVILDRLVTMTIEEFEVRNLSSWECRKGFLKDTEVLGTDIHGENGLSRKSKILGNAHKITRMKHV